MKVRADIFEMNGQSYLLLVDYLTKHSQVLNIPNKTAHAVHSVTDSSHDQCHKECNYTTAFLCKQLNRCTVNLYLNVLFIGYVKTF